MSPAQPVIADVSDGEQIWFGGGLVTFKVTSAQSDGRYVVIQDTMPRGKTTPLHLHASFDETILVISGELLVHLDGVEHAAAAGAVVSIPRGIPHALLVTSEVAEIVGIATPGDVFERFFREGGDVPTGNDSTPPPLNIEQIRAAGERTGGMEVLGPPPFAAVAVHG